MCRFAALSLMALALPMHSFATAVLYSTDGTATPGFTSGLFWQASSTPGGNLVNVEMQFTASMTGTVTSVVAPLSATVGSVTFLLRSDAGGVAGLTLDMFTFSNVTGMPQLLTAFSTMNAQLTAGTLYWLEAVGPAPDVQMQTINWYQASPPVNGTVEVENPIPTVLTNQQIAAFALPVPEPAGTWAVGVTFLAVIARRQRLMPH